MFRQLMKPLDFPPIAKYKKLDEEKQPPFQKTHVILRGEEQGKSEAAVSQSFKLMGSQNNKDEISQKLLGYLLNERISNDLREKQGIIYSPMVKVDTDDNRLILRSMTKVEKNPENIKKVLESYKAQTADLIKNPVSQKELEIVKSSYKLTGLEAFECSAERNSLISRGFDTPYGIDYVNDKLKSIDEITPDNIQTAAKLIFDNHSVISVAAPLEAIDANKDYLETKGEIIII